MIATPPSYLGGVCICAPLDCCSLLQLSGPQPAVDRISNSSLQLVVLQQAACTKAAAGCRSPKRQALTLWERPYQIVAQFYGGPVIGDV